MSDKTRPTSKIQQFRRPKTTTVLGLASLKFSYKRVNRSNEELQLLGSRKPQSQWLGVARHKSRHHLVRSREQRLPAWSLRR